MKGYRLAVLTPNPNEHKRLVDKVFGQDYKEEQPDVAQQLKDLAARSGICTKFGKIEDVLLGGPCPPDQII